MKFNRAGGILLHPTSLPGQHGIGGIGREARRYVDFLAECGCTLWQVLPLGPTGYGDSPYQSFSAFAGNPYLIDLDLLIEEGLLKAEDLAGRPRFPVDRVDYGALIPWKIEVLNRAYERFRKRKASALHEELAEFRQQQAHWLEDFALFMALKDAHRGAPWTAWKPPLRDRDPEALNEASEKYVLKVERQVFRQWLFSRQWIALREYANSKGVMIIGDVPIFVAHDSADVWPHRELYYIDKQGNPEVVAGVPPDYFSPTGQLWGNPLYRWEAHKESGYRWWQSRLAAVLQLVDIVRIDHFRGFAGYWEIPAGMPTAEKGRWVPGPGADFFFSIREGLGELPLIAEDLGEITPDVFELRDQFGLPGMKILQFAFGGDPDEDFLPHNYPQNCVAYTGTHDNDTTLGWYRSAPEKERDFCRRYLGRSDQDIVWNMIRGVWQSVAMFALAPLQDFLVLDSEARMNYPGNPSGNWTWRMRPNSLTPELSEQILDYNFIYGRAPASFKEQRKEEEAREPETAIN